MLKGTISKSHFLKLILVPALFLRISAINARTLMIEDNFNSITLSRATVAIEDHPEQNPWEFEGNIKQIRCTGGILTLAVVAGGGELKMYTKEIFKSGDFRAKIRLNNAGQGINMYMALSRYPPGITVLPG